MATMVAKQFSVTIIVSTRIFVAKPEPRSVKVRKECKTTTPDNDTSKIPVSEIRVLCCPAFQHNVKSAPIVTGQDKPRTS